MGYNLGKLRIIPHTTIVLWGIGERLRSPEEELASYQVVGGVMAYQAYDG